MRVNGMGIVNESWGRSKPEKRWLFSFGAYGSTHVLVIGVKDIEDALEVAAVWLADNAPGHLVEPDYECARTECGCCACASGELCDEACAAAETDLTHTESGWLLSWEWLVCEDPTREYVLQLQKRN